MKTYEILNRKTLARATVTAEKFSLACASVGWRPQDCKCVHWGYYHEGEE